MAQTISIVLAAGGIIFAAFVKGVLTVLLLVGLNLLRSGLMDLAH